MKIFYHSQSSEIETTDCSLIMESNYIKVEKGISPSRSIPIVNFAGRKIDTYRISSFFPISTIDDEISIEFI